MLDAAEAKTRPVSKTTADVYVKWLADMVKKCCLCHFLSVSVCLCLCLSLSLCLCLSLSVCLSVCLSLFYQERGFTTGSSRRGGSPTSPTATAPNLGKIGKQGSSFSGFTSQAKGGSGKLSYTYLDFHVAHVVSGGA